VDRRIRRARRPPSSRAARVASSRAIVDGVLIAIAATGDEAVQDAVWRRAEQLGVLCNVVDVPERCHFYVPASLRRGSLTVSVSTKGRARSWPPRFATGSRSGSSRRPARARASRRGAPDRPRAASRTIKRRSALARLLSPCAIDDLLEGRLDDFEAHWKKWTSSLSD
jgi:hypothetical protein